MVYFKAVFNLNRPIEEKAPEERSIHAKMSVLPIFNNPPIAYVDFLAAIDAQTLAVDNAEFGGIDLVAIMRTKEGIVDDMVRKYRDFVSVVADGDTDIILSSGFRHTKPRASAGDMQKVEGVKNLKSDLSGAIKLKWNPVKNAGFYEVQVREVEAVNTTPKPPVPPMPPMPPLGGNDNASNADTLVVEKPWLPFGSKPARTVITGLKSLSYYEVRVRAKGTKGFGPFSDIVVMVVT